MNAPTSTTYNSWQRAYDHFNEQLFGGALPPCLITLQRKDHRSSGYFSRERFGHMTGPERTDEIALNPVRFKSDGVGEALQTLVHEMCHLWQYHAGKPTRGYHNAEWADKMESVGLMPSNTGKPGGKRTGQQMADYAIAGGPFAYAAVGLLATGWALDWYDRIQELQAEAAGAPLLAAVLAAGVTPVGLVPPTRPNKTNRVRYDCPECGTRAWGKPGLAIKCGRHDTLMTPGE